MIKKLKNFFGLKRVPFSKTIAANELFVSQSINEIDARLDLALDNEDIALITGAAGSGKSTSLRYTLSQVDPQAYPSVYLTGEDYKISDIAKLFLAGLNIISPYNGYAALNTMKEAVKKMYNEKNQKPILIIDEAQNLPISTMVSIKNLVNFDMDSKSMMLIVLCGQYELINKIKSTTLDSLRRRIRIQYKLESLSIEECSKYISYHMNLAGIDHKIFGDDVIAEIFRISQGNICNINNICFELMIQAAINSKQIIEMSLMDKIILPA